MNIDKSKLHKFSDLLDKEHGKKGTLERDDFEKKAIASYYGEVLKDRRKELHITQEILAKKSGLNRSYIARIERGETDIRISSLVRIAETLGLKFTLSI